MVDIELYVKLVKMMDNVNDGQCCSEHGYLGLEFGNTFGGNA